MLLEHLQRQLAERDVAHARRRLRVSTGPCAVQMRVLPPGEGLDAAPTEVLAFCNNDYLGLANHPALVQAWAEGAQRYGVGSGAAHLVSGHTTAHASLERELARWQAPHIGPGTQALYFTTGYMANLALMTALGASREATLFCDKLNHASLIDGALLANAKVQRYPHADLDRLAWQLGACTTPLKLIVTDAVFSMDGSVAPLAALLQLAEAHDAWLVIDDAHGFGVLGARGEGSLGHFGLCSERLVYMGTLGKAAGVAGAFVAAHPLIIEALVNTARAYIYSTASPPAQAHALLRSLDLIHGEEGRRRRAQVQALVRHLREGPTPGAERGWHWAPGASTPIQPLIVGGNAEALALSTALESAGLWVPAIRPPTVAPGTARLRITLSAGHTHTDVDRLLAALTQAAGELP